MSAAKKLNEEQWQVLAPLLPRPKNMGRPRADDRRTLDAILFVLRSGCRWCDLPAELGSPSTAWRSTAWRRLKAWEAGGTWERIWRMVLNTLEAQDKLEWAQAFLDGSFVPAKKGALE
jgi:transposase